MIRRIKLALLKRRLKKRRIRLELVKVWERKRNEH
jgi:hypothetical protein